MLAQASVFTWLFSGPAQGCQLSTLLLRTQLSPMALVWSDPSFPVLLSACQWRAIRKARGTPVPDAKPSTLCVHGSWAGSPGEPDSHVKREGLFLSVSCVRRQRGQVLPGSGTGPAWACFHAKALEPAAITSPSTPTQKVLPQWKNQFPL